MAEQLLDLAQVRAGVEELGGEDVAERVRGDALSLADAGRFDVVSEDLAELGVVESLALDADEERLLDERAGAPRSSRRSAARARGGSGSSAAGRPSPCARAGVAARGRCRPSRDRPARRGGGPRRPSAPGAAGRARAWRGNGAPRSRPGPLPRRGARARPSSARPEALRASSASAAGSAGSRSSRSSSTRKRKKHFSAAVVRAWLETAGRRVLLLGQERAQVRHLHFRESLDPLTLQVTQTSRNVTLVRRASHRGKPPLRPAKAQEIGQFLPCQFTHRSSFGQPSGPRWGEHWAYPAYRPATEKALAPTGLFLWSRFAGESSGSLGGLTGSRRNADRNRDTRNAISGAVPAYGRPINPCGSRSCARAKAFSQHSTTGHLTLRRCG